MAKTKIASLWRSKFFTVYLSNIDHTTSFFPVTLPDVTRDLDDFQLTRLFFNRGDLEEAGIEKNIWNFSNCRVEYMFVRFIYIYIHLVGIFFLVNSLVSIVGL